MRLVMSGEKLNNILSAASNYRDEGLIKINENRILIKVMDNSESAQFACLIPKEAIYEFEPRNVNQIAVNYQNLGDFIPSSDTEVELEYSQYNNVNKLSVRHGGSEVRVPTVVKDDVPDIQANIPDIETVKILTSPDFLGDFINKCKNINVDHFLIAPREGLLYLYAKRDDSEIIERLEWEMFENYDIDWENANIPDDGSINNPKDPGETHEIDVILSRDLVDDMMFWSDRVMFNVDNHMPIKAVFEDEEGIKVSWMVAPRLPRDGEPMQLPENVMEQRSLSQMTT